MTEERRSFDENFGTRSLRGLWNRPWLVSELGTVNQPREWTLGGGKQCAAWRRHCRVYAPRGALRLTSRAQFTHHYGKGREVRKVGAPHQLHGKLRSHYLCAYTPTRATLGHATLCHATVLYSGYRWPDKEDINNAFCTNTRAAVSIGQQTCVYVRCAFVGTYTRAPSPGNLWSIFTLAAFLAKCEHVQCLNAWPGWKAIL